MEPTNALARLRATLAAVGDPERAAGQQAYMKSSMPFHGVTSPELKALLRPMLADFAAADRAEWEDLVRGIWDGATHREERYAALAVAQHRSAKRWQDPAALDLYAYLVSTGAWWDWVDEVAGRLVGPILAAHPADVTPVMDRWAVSDNLWLRRVAIISQLKRRRATDLGLLTRAIDANLEGSRYGHEFFIRKAVGWALREYAKTDPEWVRAFVADRGARLSGLSRREALKHVG